MDLIDILLAQLVEPFRIGLLVVMLFIASRTAQTVGTTIPLLLGIVVVAVLIPTSLGREEGMIWHRIAVGVVANTLILLVLLAGKELFARARR